MGAGGATVKLILL